MFHLSWIKNRKRERRPDDVRIRVHHVMFVVDAKKSRGSKHFFLFFNASYRSVTERKNKVSTIRQSLTV
jgi:hypothetical protein